MVYTIHADLTRSPPESLVATTPMPSSAALKESAAIRRALTGDANAFNYLVITYQRLAHRVAYRILQDKEAAADATQETFLRAYRSLATFGKGQFKNWLLRILTNTCYDLLRMQRRQLETAIDDLPIELESTAGLTDWAVSPDAYIEWKELLQWVEWGLRALPADLRVAVVLYDVHGYSYKEIAEIMGVPMGTVKSRLNRSRAHLRNFLLQQPELLPVGLRLDTGC